MHSRDPYHYLHIAPMQIDKVLVTMTSDKVKTMTGDKVKTMTNHCFSILGTEKKILLWNILDAFTRRGGATLKLELLLDFCPKMVFSKKRDGEGGATKCSFSHGMRICIKRKKIDYGKFFDFCAEKCVYN